MSPADWKRLSSVSASALLALAVTTLVGLQFHFPATVVVETAFVGDAFAVLVVGGWVVEYREKRRRRATTGPEVTL